MITPSTINHHHHHHHGLAESDDDNSLGLISGSNSPNKRNRVEIPEDSKIVLKNKKGHSFWVKKIIKKTAIDNNNENEFYSPRRFRDEQMTPVSMNDSIEKTAQEI